MKIPTIFLALASLLFSFHSYSQGNSLSFNENITLHTNDTTFAKNPEYFKGILVERASFNSTKKDVFPRFWEDGIIFSSNRNKKSDYDLYTIDNLDSGAITPIKNKLKTPFNETSPYLTKDGTKMYFSKNLVYNNRAQRNWTKKISLKSFVAHKKRGKWKKIKELPFNSKDYSVAHVTLNQKEDKIYFVSDMPGGYGGMDIYVADVLEDGKFGEAQNMGKYINTEKDETSPYIVNDSLFFFSSDGHKTLGGLDVLVANLNTNKIQNIGKPINSIKDDFGFVVSKDKKLGFVTSNRKEEYDIYKIKYNTSFIEENQQLLAENSINTDSLATVDNLNNSANTDMLTDAEKDKIDWEKNKEYYTSLEHDLLFNFDSYAVKSQYQQSLDDIVSVMKKNESIKITLNGHTDAIGKSNYNLFLSKKRAQAVHDYLVMNGIEKGRIRAVGKGELEPKVNCAPCTKSQMRKSRRVEIRFTTME